MFKDWKKNVITDAQNKGICNEYLELMRRADSVTDLLYLYRRGVNWALENDCPSMELMREAGKVFPFYTQGVFVDREFHGEVFDERLVYIFRHCKGTIRTGLNVTRRLIPMLYFSDGCDIKILPSDKGKVRVPVYIFGSDNRLQYDDINATVYERSVKRR